MDDWGVKEDQLFHEYLGLVNHIVNKKYFYLQYDDLEQVRAFAYEGLWRAIKMWDESKNVPFKFYAVQHIKWAIQEGQRKFAKLPRKMYQNIKDGKQIPVEFVWLDKTYGIINEYTDVQCDYNIATEVCDQSPSVLDVMLEQERTNCTIQRVRNAVQKLKPKQREIIECVDLGNMTQRELCVKRGIGEVALSRCRRRALLSLKHFLSGTQL
jgi:RNA polymerase sigma factor (sigma-70 family)